jgi:hypothetical protein
MTIEQPEWRPPAAPAPTAPQIVAGWYPDQATGMNRYWDGQQWTQHYAPPQPPVMQQFGPQIVTNTPYRMVTESHKRTSHGLHLFLTIITGGLWAIVWIIMTIVNKTTKEKVTTHVGY